MWAYFAMIGQPALRLGCSCERGANSYMFRAPPCLARVLCIFSSLAGKGFMWRLLRFGRIWREVSFTLFRGINNDTVGIPPRPDKLRVHFQ